MAIYFRNKFLVPVFFFLFSGTLFSVYVVFFTEYHGLAKVLATGAVLFVPVLLLSIFVRLFFWRKSLEIVNSSLIFVTVWRKYVIPLHVIQSFEFQGYEKRSQKLVVNLMDKNYSIYIGWLEGQHIAVRDFFKQLGIEEKSWGVAAK